MKKYLFLLLLFLIYIMCIINSNADKVSKEVKTDNYGAVSVFIKYDKGINSFELKKIFDNYSDSYYITDFNINDNDILVSCSDFDSCINDIYSIYDSDFETKYIASGFRINSISFLAYKENIEDYLSKYDIVYKTY